MKRQHSDCFETSQTEWIVQRIDNYLIITILLSMANQTEKSLLDLIAYYSNIINQMSQFKIVSYENQQANELQNQLAIIRNHLNQEYQVQNPQQFISEWLKMKQAAPFLVTFQIAENEKNLIQSKVKQVEEIVRFFNIAFQNSNLEDLYDKTILFLKTLDKV
ncbi:unnamed protein product [Paramecium sonneborni]|uniref:Uncharacterized protein n=1 Tax=Paramecium sonneborni TaxID=65129 RepID=A0A8S1R7P1_9CILI|nr:unnamed protein product [Paramecium sonneborni]